jgi:hypothetical protein
MSVVRRFRQIYGITYRTINLRYKISHSKRMHRLTVFWCNVIKTRALHARCFPGRKLRFIGFDQKPLYHCAALSAKTLNLKGKSKVAVKERVAASRERFTALTTDLSWSYRARGRWPPIAICFRTGGGDGSRIRAGLQGQAMESYSDDVLLQFAPKGSYRLETMLEFLEWCLPKLLDESTRPVAPAAGVASAPVAPAAVLASDLGGWAWRPAARAWNR